ncbi:MAG: hypothetical protein L3K17_09880, partial [Thermoplasmata archaeon]|nr:hypothetical protein [Thermoplasmata archaeon]
MQSKVEARDAPSRAVPSGDGPEATDSGPPLERAHLLWLAALALLSVFLVLQPLANFALFGSDTGEYYRLTQDLVTSGRIPTSGYAGWGSAYPDFPGIYL